MSISSWPQLASSTWQLFAFRRAAKYWRYTSSSSTMQRIGFFDATKLGAAAGDVVLFIMHREALGDQFYRAAVKLPSTACSALLLTGNLRSRSTTCRFNTEPLRNHSEISLHQIDDRRSPARLVMGTIHELISPR